MKLLITLGIILILAPLQAMAACSPYAGQATLNEFFKDRTNQSNDPDDFVEVKILDASIPYAVFSEWTLQVCEDNEPGNNNDADGCSGQVSISVFSDTTLPWLVLKDNSIGRYFNLKTGFDAILKDSDGDVIDYISVDGYTSLEDPGCTSASLPYDSTFGAPGASDKFIFRDPDGTGNWDSANAASEPSTEDDSNDGGVDVPALSFSNVSIEQGTTTATVTLNLGFVAGDDILINFSTLDGTLSAPDDYSAVNTSATISAGSTSITFTIPVSATADPGEFKFFVGIDTTSAGKATITNHTGTVTVTAPPAPSVDHYVISHSGAGVTCEAEVVTITPHDSGHVAVAPAASTTITLTTSQAIDGWALSSGNGTFSAPAQYSFDGSETSVAFWLTRTTATTAPHIDIDVTDGSASDPDDGGVEDPVLAFRDTALRFYADGVHNSIATQVAGKLSSIVPGNQELTLRAVQTDSDSGACEARVEGTQTLQMSFDCVTPATCKDADGVRIRDKDGNLIAIPDAAPGADVTLSFDVSGKAVYSMDYTDAGLIQLSAVLNIPALGEDPADTLIGSSNNFVSKPAGLCVTVPEADSDCVSGDITCTKFRRAGEVFNVRVQAVGWQTAGETDADFCVDNALVPNFELAGMGMAANLVSPAAGVAGNLLVSAFDMDLGDDGDHTIAVQSISEVGVFTFSVTPPLYFGEAIAASRSVNAGRFYPDHFILSDTRVTNRSDLACAPVSTFTYMNENFQVAYDLTAMSVGGANITRNYIGSFARLDAPAELNYGAVDLTGPINLSGRLSPGAPVINFVAGVADDITDVFTFDRLVAGPDGPYVVSIGVAPQDEDSVQLLSYDLDVVAGGGDDHALIQIMDIQYGRMVISNAFGSELVPLNIPLAVQVYDGATSTFRLNSQDSCSAYDVSNIDLTAATYIAPLSSGSLGLSGAGSMLNGAAQITMHDDIDAAAGPGVTGEVLYRMVVAPYLKYDWDGDGLFDDDPEAKASFGIFNGDSRQIYFRQIFR